MQVTDEVTVMYTVTPADHSLASVILRHQEYIQTASKTPIRNAGISLTIPLASVPYLGSGMNKKIMIRIRSLGTVFWVKNTCNYLFDADPEQGSGIFLTLDPGSGMEKF